MNIELTEERINKIEEKWSEYAKEKVECTNTPGDYIEEGITVVGSEIACLRLYYMFRGNGTVKYSKNLDKWYFVNKKN